MATKKPRSAAQEAAMQEAQDAKDTAAATAAYDKAMPSPERHAKGGSVKGWGIARGARKAKIV